MISIIEYLIRFAFVFMNNFLVAFFTYKAMDKKLKINIKSISIIIIFTILICLNQTYSLVELRLLGNYLIEIFMLMFLGKQDLKKQIFYFSVIMTFGIIVEILTTIILSIFFKSIFEVNFLSQLITMIFCYLFWFGGWHLLSSNNKIKTILAKLENIISRYFTLELLAMIMFVAIDIILVKKHLNFQENFLVFAAIISLNLLLILILIILKTKFKEESLRVSNKFLQDNIELYEKIVNDHKVMKHNLVSDFIAVKTLSNSKSQKAIDEIIKKYQKDYEWINSINEVPEGLRGLFCFKILEANKKKVRVISECSSSNLKDITNAMPVKRYLNLCEKLEVLLNNAIEAACQSKDKYIKIKIENVSKNKIKIEILNTFDNELDLSRIGQKEYSTKMRDSGFGLYSIIKNKSEHIKVAFKIISNIYIVTLIVDLKNKKSYKK